MTRVLVTGATGLIGRAVVPALRQAGYDVITSSRSAICGSDHITADLADRSQADALLRVADPQVLLHLAGGPASSPSDLIRSNVDITSTLLQALASREAPLQRLVVVGSAAEYGEGQGRPLREDDPATPVSSYGRAKLAQRLLVEVMSEHVAGSTVLARPFNVVAPDLPASTPLGNLRRQLASTGESGRVHVSCGRLDLLRDFLSVSSVAEGLVQLVGVLAPPAVVNLCSGRATLMSDLFEAVAQRSGRQVTFVQDEALARLPAAASVVGDAGLAGKLGLIRAESVHELASVLLEGIPATGRMDG